jgi:hypothetical protein
MSYLFADDAQQADVSEGHPLYAFTVCNPGGVHQAVGNEMVKIAMKVVSEGRGTVGEVLRALDRNNLAPDKEP